MSSSNSTLAGRGSHQLVSEQGLEPLPEASREGSSGHGESGGTTSARGRASTVEDRIISIEDTMRALSGTVFNISNQFDKIEGIFDRIEERVDNFERMLEELARSRHDHEFSNPKLHQTPSLHSPIAVQNSFPHIHMSTSPVNANMKHSWRGSPPVMHQALSVPEQTPEESIRFLRAIAQKYKGDSKSYEEQIQILTAAYQKYKERRDASLLVEDQDNLYQEEDDSLVEATSEYSVDTEDVVELQSVGYNDVHMVWNQGICVDEVLSCAHDSPLNDTPVEATYKPMDINNVAKDAVLHQIHGDRKPDAASIDPYISLASGICIIQSARFYGQGTVFKFASTADCSSYFLLVGVIDDHVWAARRLKSEGISFYVLVWDPGIQVRLSSTLRQGRFEGEGLIRTLFLIAAHLLYCSASSPQSLLPCLFASFTLLPSPMELEGGSPQLCSARKLHHCKVS